MSFKPDTQKMKVLGIDPSLRNTGLAVVTYDKSLDITDPKAFQVTGCQVVCNPKEHKGTNAILSMLDMLADESMKEVYESVNDVIIESPPTIFSKTFSVASLSSIAHITGGCIMAFHIGKAHIFRPTEWNRSRQKDVTHAQTVSILGDPSTWTYEKKTKNAKYMEHILDAASMALFWIRSNQFEG